MSSKRVLSLLLAICLIVSLTAPSAVAVTVEQDTYADGSAGVSERNSSNLIVSREDTAKNGSSSLRDADLSGKTVDTTDQTNAGTTKTGNVWTATPSDKEISVSLKETNLPACIEEIHQASEIYSDNDVVAAFIVLEDAPLAVTYGDIDEVSVSEEAVMIARQDAVIEAIEEDVLDGEELNVRYQFTYLTNSIAVRTEFGNLEQIAMLEGVKSVFLMPVYNPCETETSLKPTAASSGVMSGVPEVWADCGYTGTGMKIAVIDTGLDLDHPSFAADPETNENSLTLADVEAVLSELNAKAMMPGVSASQLYRSVKVPFAFNYVDEGLSADHSKDSQGSHGTHVAGIAAANKVEGTDVVGMAPDAQILVMKVFGQNGGAYTDDILAALEDAMRLDCDVVNMSLGSPAGFSSDDPEIDAIYERIAAQDIIVAVASGNEATSGFDNLWGTDLNLTSNPDNGTVGSPATYMNTTTVASVDNAMAMSTYFTVDGTNVAYYDGSGLYVVFADLGTDEPLEYVMVDGLGYAEDFEGVDVEGKIAVVSRGTINFSTKLANAEAAGAIGLIIWNNEDDMIGIQLTDEDGNLPEGVSGIVPAVIISKADGQLLANAEEKTLVISAEEGPVADGHGGQMSSFSSWGVTPDLRLLPEITGVGGNVYSSVDGGRYAVMSGTSMATPQVAGISALVLEYLHNTFPNAGDAEIRTMADALLMSTAVPVICSTTGLEASPRQQGAGLVNALNAVTSEAYLTVNGGKPKAELKDSTEGVYSFTFTVHNFGAEPKTYSLNASLLTEEYTTIGGREYMAGVEHELSGTVAFSQDTVTVGPGGSVTVTATVTLSEADKAWMDAHYENGIYVDGFVYLDNWDVSGVDLSLPFMGFYGDWTDAPLFDTAYWYNDSFWRDDVEPDGNQYFHVFWTDLDGTSWVLGFNPYVAVPDDYDWTTDYDPAHNVISNNGDRVLDGLDDIYLSLMRNARKLTFTYTDEAGEIVHVDEFDNARKSTFMSVQIIPFVYSWYGSIYDFTDENGDPLPNNTKLTLTVTAELDYGDGVENALAEIPITLDTQAPSLMGQPVETTDGEHNYLTLLVSENAALADVFVMNPAGTRILAEQPEYTDNGDGTYTVVLDVTGFGTEMTVILCDYGANEAVYDVTYVSSENLPEMDKSALYAYRVSDFDIGNDTLYGWVTIDKEDASVAALTSDYLEDYALTAAEYAGGYVFAVDAAYNLVAMVPGLWNRIPICNLGGSALDMTYDKTTNTMYAVVKNGSYTDLVTLDLITGEMTTVKTYYYGAPWAMAADDNGTIYAIKQGSSYLWKLNDSYDLEYALDSEGNQIQLLNSDGRSVYPYYSQSMTYSSADNCLYWAYYSYMDMPELFTIDLETMTYSSVPFASYSEYVGLLTLDDDSDFTIPSDSELTGLKLSDESLLLKEGEKTKLTVNSVPWNAKMGQVTWTSDDESVATVDENGNVTAVSQGVVVITAACGDVSADCYVTVVKVEGTVHAYNYYTGNGNYGDWLSIDLAGMTTESLYDSPVDFLVADYNGHDGYIYGYDEMGQFYRFSPETGDCDALGTPLSGSIPMDMAYDYSSGFMYASTYDNSTGISALNYVNMRNGALVEIAQSYSIYMTLACDMDGVLFSVTADGVLMAMFLVPGSSGGIMPYDEFDDDFGFGYGDEEDDSLMIEEIVLLEDLGYLNYAQSMCYDHNTGKLVWSYTENGDILWMDPYAEEPYIVSLGDPTGTGLFQYIGLYSVPEEIPELAPVAVEEAYAEDITVMTGSTKNANVTILPLNANDAVITWNGSDDESIATVDEFGAVTGVSKGVTTINGTLTDGENTFDLSFQVTVLESGDNLFGFVVTDLASYGGDIWVEIDDANPSDPAYLEYSSYLIYAEEYYDGKLYAYGYDEMDWEANWQFFVIDPETYEIESQLDMGETFPWVYDMTYNYASGTMYAVAGYNDSTSDVYMVDMETGRLIPVISTEPFFTSIAASADGTLYAMADSEEWFDEYTWEGGFGNAMLYKLDPVNGTYELVGDTGVQSNMLSSMTFDFDTGNLYWTPVFRADYFSSVSSGLYMVNPETGVAQKLGLIGAAGSQVSGLYTIADSYPAEPEAVLQDVKLTETSTSVYVGDSKNLEYYVLPLAAEPSLTWTSADESIATVDENGVVTGVSVGVTTVTVTATEGNTVVSATCAVRVMDPETCYLSYDRTAHGWARISMADPGQVTVIHTDADTDTEIKAAVYVGDMIYAYDVDGNFLKIDQSNDFARESLGAADVTADASEGLVFEIRDLAYDAANERLLALGATYYLDETYGYISEIYDGCRIYQVDLTNGHLEELCILSELSQVRAMTVDHKGTVYVYNCWDDYLSKVDLDTGAVTSLSTLQSLSAYGSTNGDPLALCYDPVGCMVYLMFTGNGKYYQIYSFNPATNALAKVGNVGELTYRNWAYYGDTFAGLMLDSTYTATEHTHAWGAWTVLSEPTCTESGERTHTCLLCGETVTETVEALGHSWDEGKVVKEPTCEEAGEMIYTCTRCGETRTEAIEATGHNYVDVVTKPTETEKGYTTHTCTECGHSYVDSYTDPIGENVNTGDGFQTALWISLLVFSFCGVAILVTGRKKWNTK